MSSAPKDQTVKEVVSEVKEITSAVPLASTVTREEILLLEKTIVQAFPGTPLAREVSAAANQLLSGLTSTNAAAAGIAKLIAQFGLPLSLAGGVKLQGTGAIVGAVTGAETKLLDGVRYAMTNRQKIVTEISGWLTLAVTVVGAVLSLYPQLGTTALGSGLTVGILIQGIKNVILPRINQYGDTK